MASRKPNRLKVYKVTIGISNQPNFYEPDELSAATVRYLREQMAENIVTIKFRKENGQIAIRRGTLHPSYTGIYFERHPSEAEQRYVPDDLIRYWDVDKTGHACWGSCRVERLMGWFADMEPIETSNSQTS